jgi:glycerol uptake operon antiterminator
MVLIEKLKKKPVIAGIRDLKDIPVALERGVTVIFFLRGDIFDLIQAREEVKSSGALLFPHMDLMKGIARDEAGIRFLSQKICIDGIITTHVNLIRFAKKERLITVQRMFVLDSEALETGIKVVHDCKPDAVEILPGIILPNLKSNITHLNLPPIIAGGLIKTEADVKKVLESGALAVSASRKELWRI